MKTLLNALLLSLLVATPALAAPDLKDDLLGREKALWKAWGEKEGAPFRAQASEDYVQVVAGVGIVAGREAVAKEIEGHTLTRSPCSN